MTLLQAMGDVCLALLAGAAAGLIGGFAALGVGFGLYDISVGLWGTLVFVATGAYPEISPGLYRWEGLVARAAAGIGCMLAGGFFFALALSSRLQARADARAQRRRVEMSTVTRGSA